MRRIGLLVILVALLSSCKSVTDHMIETSVKKANETINEKIDRYKMSNGLSLTRIEYKKNNGNDRSLEFIMEVADRSELMMSVLSDKDNTKAKICEELKKIIEDDNNDIKKMNDSLNELKEDQDVHIHIYYKVYIKNQDYSISYDELTR